VVQIACDPGTGIGIGVPLVDKNCWLGWLLLADRKSSANGCVVLGLCDRNTECLLTSRGERFALAHLVVEHIEGARHSLGDK
jgi:hypothetical protein